MKLSEVHPQVSPDQEICDLCAQEELARVTDDRPYIEANTIINPFTDYHWVGTQEGIFYDLCDKHYYNVASLQ